MAKPLEPTWYGPVCPVVWEGRSREAPPYPDLWHSFTVTACRPRASVDEGNPAVPMGED
jgi:hypothetical protein